MSATEGTYEWQVPGLGKAGKTYYKVYGDLKSGAPPLVVLHGGPGIPHPYLTSLAALASAHAVVFYDQLGCGNSTHLPEKRGDERFWTVDLFLGELEGLLKHLGVEKYDLYGHSWGGTLAASHAAKQPKGLRRLILADALADAKTCGRSVYGLLSKMPNHVQSTIQTAQVKGLFESEDYKKAIVSFYNEHICRVTPWPEEVKVAMGAAEQDSTVYFTMWGADEFSITGNLKDWTIVSELHKITAPTLVLNGRYDLVQDSCVVPFFREIPKVKWYTFAESSHMPHVEEKALLLKFVGEFLQ